jgi:hypothetical protein
MICSGTWVVACSSATVSTASPTNRVEFGKSTDASADRDTTYFAELSRGCGNGLPGPTDDQCPSTSA